MLAPGWGRGRGPRGVGGGSAEGPGAGGRARLAAGLGNEAADSGWLITRCWPLQRWQPPGRFSEWERDLRSVGST